jgi:penicillin-binding protein 2
MADDPNKPTYDLRLYLLAGVVVLFLGLLILRLWQVQVREGSQHVKEIARESIRPIRLNAVRGRLLAADRTVLVDNDCRYDLVFHVSEMRRHGGTITYLIRRSLDFARLLDRPAPLNKKAVLQHLNQAPAMPMVVFENLTPAEVAKVMELSPPVPGVSVEPRAVRRYLYPSLASHVLGWVGRERPGKTEEMDQYQSAYIGYEMRGRGGVEREYDELLSGEGGHKLVRVDPVGYIHEEIGIPREPVDGRDLLLTLDPKAQAAADRALAGKQGAFVVLDVNSGAIIAMASSPTFSQNELALDNYHYEELSKEEGMPMLNRAVDGRYAPGSIVKPLIALAALECGAIVPATTYNCDGSYHEHRLHIRCASRWGHGELDLVNAIKLSCNPYFINAGIKTGLANIQPMLAAAGFGRRPGIDLPSADKGLFPTREYAVRTRGPDQPWGMADTALISIGQGLSVITPLQVALYTAALANGGLVYRPFLVRSVLNADGTVWRNTAPVVEHRLPTTPEHLAVVQQGMYEVVNGENGSGSRAKNDVIMLAGKTGSAEVKPRNKPKTKNTWFIAFGPYTHPKYACAMVIEDGDSGGRTSAPRVKQFFEQWLGAAEESVQATP